MRKTNHLQARRQRIRARRREDGELALVELDIGYGDQRFMAAAVVPAEVALLRAARAKERQHAFDVGSHVVLFVEFDVPSEEIGGWHLARVADDDRLPTPQQRAERIDRFHLRGLVEDNDVELDLAGRQEAGDGHRAHHEDRFDRLHRAAGLIHELADRHQAPFLVGLVAHDGHLSRIGKTRLGLPDLLGEAGLRVAQG